MSIDRLIATEIGAGEWYVEAIGSITYPVRWYIDGQEWGDSQVNWLTLFAGTSGLQVEAFDADNKTSVPMDISADGLTIHWHGDPSAVRYEVFLYDGQAWVLQSSIKEDEEPGYTVRINGLEDEITHQIRIDAVDVTGTSTTIATRAAFLVRVPDVPDQTISISGGTITCE